MTVKRRFDTRLAALAAEGQLLRGGLRGVEKECLRVTPEGYIAQSGHPQALGSALTNHYITTDYSEALIEFITPPQRSTPDTVAFLADIHQFAWPAIGAELFWPMSMPCHLRGEEDIPIARYGSSNVATMKTVYRRGLGFRYGRYMQTIAGVHFNYSLPADFWGIYAGLERVAGGEQALRSAAYLDAVRNVRRMDWLLLYLFGASPAVCGCFPPAAGAGLERLADGTWFAPHATSLRMSDLGYKNASQAGIWISANSLDEYTADLCRAIRTPSPAFQRIGLKVDGLWRQLNPNQLQIENEYYSTVRPKRTALSGERPTSALRRGGIEYLELRVLDLDPFSPVGVSERELLFCEVFLVFCLLWDSPPISAGERAAIDSNHRTVARRGREPGLVLQRDGGAVAMADWAADILQSMHEVAGLLDEGDGTAYRDAVRDCAALLHEPEATPSARMLEALRGGESLVELGLRLAGGHRRHFLSVADGANRRYQLLETEALSSLDRQCWIEEHDTLSFDDYLAAYYA